VWTVFVFDKPSLEKQNSCLGGFFIMMVIAFLLGMGYLAVCYRFGRSFLQPFAYRALLILTGIELGLVWLYLALKTNKVSGFWDWYFDLSSEFAVGATYSAVQLLAVGCVALVIGLWLPAVNVRQRVAWFFLGGLFILLNLDEYYLFHDLMPETQFILIGAVVLVFVLLAAWMVLRQARHLLVLLMVGFFVMGGSQVLDAFLPITPAQVALEEFMEMSGVTLVLVAVLSYAQVRLPFTIWLWNKRLLAGVCGAWTVWLLASFWLGPTLAWTLSGEPAQIQFQGSDLELVGYQLDAESWQPGDVVDLTLYWKTNRPLSDTYGVSVHLLTHPQIDSIKQADKLLTRKVLTPNWPVNVILPREIRLRLPDDLPTPASYWLSITTWNEDDYVSLEIAQHDQGWRIEPDTLILVSIPVLSSEATAPPSQTVDYVFADGFTLAGYDLPETVLPGETLPVLFWWRTDETAVEGQYTQFVHLFADDGETFIAGYDRQPFAGRFPTADWTADMGVMDTWDIALPADLEAGVYHLYTGMYDSASAERLAVTNADDTVQDNVIALGTFTVAP
jgi:hypothetical protein